MVVSIEDLGSLSVTHQKVELVERKGIGHPDYLIDACSESVSVALSKYYLKNYGKIFHHNVDKGILVGGKSKPEFGGGIIEEPIEIIVVGRAVIEINSQDQKKCIPIDSISINAMKNCIKNLVRYLDIDKDIKFDYKIREGSKDLVGIFDVSNDVPLANDTSIGIGYAPFSSAENLTLNIEKLLNSKKTKNKFPAIGEDIKVMTLREKNDMKVTVAMPLIDRFVKNIGDYFGLIDNVKLYIDEYVESLNLDGKVKLYLNSGDDRSKNIIYLTVTGTSAEAGDDGNTGRGNRVNGLHTPGRPMTLEASAGKNPINHVGKLYNVSAQIICERIYDEIDGIKEINVEMLSKIGSPIDKPQMVNLKLIWDKSKNFDILSKKAHNIAQEEIVRIPNVTNLILEQKVNLF